MSKIELIPFHTCWEWVGYRDYRRELLGRAWFHYNGRPHTAARIAWMLFCGDIPKGKHVLHSCDNPGCVNPNHLFLGTQADNIRDMLQKGRQRNVLASLNSMKTHCLYGHLLKKTKTQRRCQICSNERDRKNYDPNKRREKYLRTKARDKIIK